MLTLPAVENPMVLHIVVIANLWALYSRNDSRDMGSALNQVREMRQKTFEEGETR